MTTLSVRDLAGRHLDKDGDLSVDADVYGYIHRDGLSRLFGGLAPTDVLPGSGTPDAPTTRSLRRHLETISGRSIDLVVFLVAHEPDFSGDVTVEQVAKLQYALQVARDLYAQVDIGIRRIEWASIPVADAQGYAEITSVFGALGLTTAFTGRDGAIDLFLVQTMGVLTGRSPKGGPCGKHNFHPWVPVMTGCVMEFAGTPQYKGITIAHEVGHYLGLGHEPIHDNVMCGPSGQCEPSEDMLELTSDQAATMRSHCMMVAGD